MPVYEYRCDECGHEREHMSAKYEILPEYPCCEKDCKGTKKYKFSVPGESDSTLGYPRVNDMMGHEPIMVEGRAHRRKLMKKLGISDASKCHMLGGIG